MDREIRTGARYMLRLSRGELQFVLGEMYEPLCDLFVDDSERRIVHYSVPEKEIKRREIEGHGHKSPYYQGSVFYSHYNHYEPKDDRLPNAALCGAYTSDNSDVVPFESELPSKTRLCKTCANAVPLAGIPRLVFHIRNKKKGGVLCGEMARDRRTHTLETYKKKPEDTEQLKWCRACLKNAGVDYKKEIKLRVVHRAQENVKPLHAYCSGGGWYGDQRIASEIDAETERWCKHCDRMWKRAQAS